MIEDEVWKEIEGYSGDYQVSTWGRVRSLKQRDAKILSPRPTGKPGNKYLALCLFREGVMSEKRVHRLVLETFVGQPPIGMIACHNDGNRLNNRLDNLRWDAPSGNVADMKSHGRLFTPDSVGTANGNAKLTDADVLFIREQLSLGVSGSSLARRFSITPTAVSSIKLLKAWKHV